MSDQAPTRRPLSAVLDEAMMHAELEEYETMSPAARDEELAAMGYDASRTSAAVDAALAKVLGGSASTAPTATSTATRAKEGTNVASLAAHRAKRAWWSLSPQLAVAALVVLFVGGEGAWKIAHRMPTGTVAYPTLIPPPTPLQLANFARRQALASCEAEYCGEAEDLLDAAAKDDPTSEDRDDVKACRKAIEDHDAHRTKHRRGGFDAKLPVAPNEKPLQPLLKERPLQPSP